MIDPSGRSVTIEDVLAEEHRRRRRTAPSSIVVGVVALAVSAWAIHGLLHLPETEPVYWLVAAMPALFGALSLVRGIVILFEKPLLRGST